MLCISNTLLMQVIKTRYILCYIMLCNVILCYVILYIINANYKNHIYILLMNNIKSHINIIKKVWSKYNYYMSNTLLMKIIKKQYIRNILLMQIKKEIRFV